MGGGYVSKTSLVLQAGCVSIWYIFVRYGAKSRTDPSVGRSRVREHGRPAAMRPPCQRAHGRARVVFSCGRHGAKATREVVWWDRTRALNITKPNSYSFLVVNRVAVNSTPHALCCAWAHKFTTTSDTGQNPIAGQGRCRPPRVGAVLPQPPLSQGRCCPTPHTHHAARFRFSEVRKASSVH